VYASRSRGWRRASAHLSAAYASRSTGSSRSASRNARCSRQNAPPHHREVQVVGAGRPAAKELAPGIPCSPRCT
jgi:hypothetical protein